jgi:molybdopterin synthase sulfur carrier subunit
LGSLVHIKTDRMNIQLFGMTRDIAGTGRITLANEEARHLGTVGALKAHLVKTYPALGELSSLAVAVNREYAKDDVSVTTTDEIALIPPVSGG